MVLISIHPFASWKIFLLGVALLGLSSALCLADPLFMAGHSALSHDQGRSALIVAPPRQNPEPLSKNLRSVASSDLKDGGDIRFLISGDMDLVQAEFQVDQYLAARTFVPFCQMPVGVRSNIGLTLALSGADTPEGGGF
jgi:hypothetical protein